MGFYGIMLNSEMEASSHTYPIAEKRDSQNELDHVTDLNNRVSLRENKNSYNITIIDDSSKSYHLIQENTHELGSIYQFTEK